MSKLLYEKTLEFIDFVATVEKLDVDVLLAKLEEMEKMSEENPKTEEDRKYRMKATILMKKFNDVIEESFDEIENEEFFKKMDRGEI